MPKDIDKEKAILNFLKSPDEIDPEVIRQGLKDFGYDPDEVAAEGRRFVEGLLSEAARQADEMESQEFNIPADLDKAIADALCRKLNADCQHQLCTLWRNLDKATREDKIQLLKDIRLLKALGGSIS